MKALDFNFFVNLPPGIVFVPFLPEHASRLTVEQPEVLAFGPADVGELLRYQAANGLAVTILNRGKPIAVFGTVNIWAGVEEGWFLLEEEFREYRYLMTRAGKLFVRLKFQDDSLHRLQITVRCDDNRAFKWAKAIGFQQEGVMRKYGPDGSDFYIMAIVKES